MSARLISVAAGSAVALAAWAASELTAARPLVDPRAPGHRSVLAATGLMLLLGVGVYPVLPLVVWLVRTPRTTRYGFGASVVVGPMLVPFSLASFAVSRVSAPARSGCRGSRHRQ